MTEPQWQTHTPQYDGHAPDDWDGSMDLEFKMRWTNTGKEAWVKTSGYPAHWREATEYRYRAKPCLQDATHEPDLLAQCLRLPQADRDALIEALQKRDWAEDVWSKADEAFGNDGKVEAAAVIRSMCRPKEEN